MRKMGREPSRLDLASFFAAADADEDADQAAGATKAEALPTAEAPALGEKAAKARKTARFAPGALEDYTVKAGVCAPPRVPDYSVRAGSAAGAASGRAAAAQAQGSGRFPGGEEAAVGGAADGSAADMADRSVRFRKNIAATPEAFAARFGPYQGQLGEGNDSSGSGRGRAAADPNPNPAHLRADPSVRFRNAVAPPEGGFAAKFGAYSNDPRALIPGDSGHGPAEKGGASAAMNEAAGGNTPGKPQKARGGGLFGRRATPGARLSLDAVGAPERSPDERNAAAGPDLNPLQNPLQPPVQSVRDAAAVASPRAPPRGSVPAGLPRTAEGFAQDPMEYPGQTLGPSFNRSSGGFGLPRLPEGHRASMDAEGRVKGSRMVRSSIAAAAAAELGAADSRMQQ